MTQVWTPNPNGYSSDPRHALRLWGIEHKLILSREAADFYSLYWLVNFSGNPNVTGGAEGILETHTHSLTEQLSRYLDAACGGELRHYLERGTTRTLPLATHKAPVLVPYLKASQHQNRYRAWQMWYEVRRIFALEAVESGVRVFNSGLWGSGFGGRRWGAAMTTLLQYLDGSLSEIAFVDTAFGVEHNFGAVFNKVWSTGNLRQVCQAALTEDLSTLAKFSSAKIQSMIKLVRGEGEKGR